MDKEEIFSILYGKEKKEIWHEIQEIEKSIENSDSLYNFFDDIKNMLVNEKSYIKMRGFRLVCKMSKWDKDNKIDGIIDMLLEVLDDEKPTIVRMCFQSINDLLLYKPGLLDNVQRKVKSIDISQYKGSMKPLIKKDIDYILKSKQK